jgi:flagellar hook-basal body complex protein FliE
MDVKTIGVPPLGGFPAAPAVSAPAPAAAGEAKPAATGESSFGEVLKSSLSQVNALQHQADGAIRSLATGGTTTLHDTMLALQQAELSFKLMMQVRNKIVEAYQEVLRMQV